MPAFYLSTEIMILLSQCHANSRWNTSKTLDQWTTNVFHLPQLSRFLIPTGEIFRACAGLAAWPGVCMCGDGVDWKKWHEVTTPCYWCCSAILFGKTIWYNCRWYSKLLKARHTILLLYPQPGSSSAATDTICSKQNPVVSTAVASRWYIQR